MLGVFDPAAVGRQDLPPPLPELPIEALDHGPVGRTEGGSDVHIRFNQAIGALDLDAAALEGVLVLDPPIAGRTSWRSPELLVFTPAESWAPAQRYTVRLAKPLTTADGGRRFEETIEWSFETPRPQVLAGGAITTSNSHRHRRTNAYVVFDTPVSLAEARRHIVATARPGMPLAKVEKAVDEELARFLAKGNSRKEERE